LADHLGVSRKRLRLANSEQVLAITGYPVGTVPPFGHRQRLETLIEQRVLAQQVIYVGGGEINALLRLESRDLLAATQATVVSLRPDESI
jgi:prolyl-tRNA editing enzyme YbaK/EbsC (Cys-tRNA(Pro) deacylase)